MHTEHHDYKPNSQYHPSEPVGEHNDPSVHYVSLGTVLWWYALTVVAVIAALALLS